MAVRLREADSMAAMAELRQKIAELEIQVCVWVYVPLCLYRCVQMICMLTQLIDLTVPSQCVFQKEEGLIQGQLNHSDSRQYITQLRDQITELKNEVRDTHR